MERSAIIVAGGLGKRMGASIPKQFLLLKGKPLLCYSIDAFRAVSYTHLRAHETVLDLVCRLLLEKKQDTHNIQHTMLL